jgi:hypothetical protein
MKINEIQLSELEGKSKFECELIIKPAVKEWFDNQDMLLVEIDDILEKAFPDECVFSSLFNFDDDWLKFDKEAYRNWLSDGLFEIIIILDNDGSDIDKLQFLGALKIDIKDNVPMIIDFKAEPGQEDYLRKSKDALQDYVSKSEFINGYINLLIITSWFEHSFE